MFKVLEKFRKQSKKFLNNSLKIFLNKTEIKAKF